MSFNVQTISSFEKQARKLLRKYPSLKQELLALVNSLEQNPFQGDRLILNCYKIRLPIKSKVSGKSGGARVITNLVVVQQTVYLVSIYDKSDKDTITNKELKELIRNI
jgi:mRNA-degrading endonuclease RelE of RelBE toxin-antitoxin system